VAAGVTGAAVIGRMQRGWELWPPARERLSRPPIELLPECRFDSSTWDAASLELLVQRVGAERVLLGSDYPFIMGEDRPGAIIEASRLPEHEQAAILGGNAEQLLGLGAAA
jgi:aminocarboxymuconate-semialdehyde decarboxylase